MRSRGLLLPLLLVTVAGALCSRSALQLRRPVLLLSGGSAPSEWSQHTTDDGRVYYYDSVSGTSSWTPPPELATGDDHATPEDPAASTPELPDGWSAHMTDDGRTYYYHQPSGQSSWESPIAESAAGGQSAADEAPLEEARTGEEAMESLSPESDPVGADGAQPSEEQPSEEQASEDATPVDDFAALLAARARSYREGAASQGAEPQDTFGAEASEMAEAADPLLPSEASGVAEEADTSGETAEARAKRDKRAKRAAAPEAKPRSRGWWWLCCGSSEEELAEEALPQPGSGGAEGDGPTEASVEASELGRLAAEAHAAAGSEQQAELQARAAEVQAELQARAGELQAEVHARAAEVQAARAECEALREELRAATEAAGRYPNPNPNPNPNP